MRRFFLILGAIFAFSVSSQAQLAPDVAEVRDTIGAQIEAFQAEDVEAAFGFASPFIQRMFQTPGNFGMMVQDGYPMVWDPSEVRFFDQMIKGNTLFQRVQFLDKAGDAFWFAYEMIQIDGVWRINGVFPIEPVDLSA